jgi:acid phosphatase
MAAPDQQVRSKATDERSHLLISTNASARHFPLASHISTGAIAMLGPAYKRPLAISRLVLLISICLVMYFLHSIVFLALAPATAHAFDLYEHLGNLSPYFVPPNTPASLLSGTPESCSVDRAFLIHRHGSRQPLSSELPTIQNLSYYINNNTALFKNPHGQLPDEFSFLSSGWSSTFTSNNLSAVGRQQLFDHGVALRLDYPSLYTDSVLAGDQDRVVESAQWFMDGYYGRYARDVAVLNKIAEDNLTTSWITPMDICQTWEYSSGNDLVNEWGKVYLPKISSRINTALSKAYPNVSFTPQNAHGMLWACAYGTAIYGVGRSPWCNVFKEQEILDFEYELDLLMRGAFGYGLPQGQGGILGNLLVSNVTAFMQGSGTRNLSLNFAHDTTIDLGLGALGLAYDEEYPADGPPSPSRKWRTSSQVPFAAQMLWKRLSCSGNETRIQLELNGANFDLSPVGCQSDYYGTCKLADFAATWNVQKALNTTAGDASWRSACT